MDQAAFELGVITGRREMAERAAALIRQRVSMWRTTGAKASGVLGSVRAALLWSITEAWYARCDELAAMLETEAAGLRTEEGRRIQALQATRVPKARRWPWR